MGLKVDSSFLKFVTMGALGTRRVLAIMEAAGLRPIELERFSSGNKIWATKVKRLRMPDLLCVRTGLRVEVRTKSSLTIKMSDAERNEERRWNSGLNGEDLVAFVLVTGDAAGELEVAESAEFFEIAELEDTVEQSKLGPPKSASEGAERDRVWPATVPKDGGVVIQVDEHRITALLDSGRRQSYNIIGKTAYVGPGDRFEGNSQFIAGVPARKAVLPDPQLPWDPRPLLGSNTAMDRHVAVKALGVIGSESDIGELTRIMETDPDKRVALEAAGSAARLGDTLSLEFLRESIYRPQIDYLAMESVLILSELRNTPGAARSVEILDECASSVQLIGSELRQAAIWGLGSSGHQAYARLLRYLDSEEIDERVHALCAFGDNQDAATLALLINQLSQEAVSIDMKASVSYLLIHSCPARDTAEALHTLYQTASELLKNWVLATLGQMAHGPVTEVVNTKDILDRLAPVRLAAANNNWILSDAYSEKVSFVRKQML